MPYDYQEHCASWREILISWALAITVVAASCGIHLALDSSSYDAGLPKPQRQVKPTGRGFQGAVVDPANRAPRWSFAKHR